MRLPVAAVAVALLALGAGKPPPTRGQSPARGGGTPAGGRETIGCTSRPGATVSSGPGSRVALTFDDGPSLDQTPAILGILDRLHVNATFFVIGRHVAGRETLLGEILASGDEIGNHSFHHPTYPGYGELASTNRAIEAATGFRPCLVRPPYGLVNRGVESAARRLGLELVTWNVESADDKHPGVVAIRSKVLHRARPGSIILMHDGGHHPQTVRALPGIINGLRARGFGFATVTSLLGGQMLYR
jgi:peptidoglycan/xylan/chitin deacetylase (PgdA/CDA1 family)